MKKTFLALGLLLGFLGISVVSSQKAYAKEVDFQTHITSEQEDEAEAEVIYKFTTRKIFDEIHATYEVEDKNEDKTYLVAFAKDEFKYVCSSAGLNLRSFPNVLYDNIEKTVPYGTELKVIASSKTGWAIVKFEDEKYFCWEPSLSYEKPEPKPEVPTIVYVEELESESTIETQETILNTIEEVEVETEAPTCSCAYYTADQLKNMGVIHWNGWRWTWYSQRILPGEGLVIPGRHVDENGYICDENDYICLAASSLSKGSIVDTPFGKLGKVYDCGCAYGTLDVYTDF